MAHLRTLVLAALLASILVGSASADTAPIAVLAAVVGALVASAIPDRGKKPAETPPV